MAKLIFLCFVFFVSTAKLAEAICCELIKSQVVKKIEANKTLCAFGNTLPSNCCQEIANEVEKHILAYKTFCSSNETGKKEGTLKQCRAPKALGIQTGKIPDNAFTASSYFSANYKPWYGRLNTNTGHCAWTSTAQGRKNSWFQVDLGQVTIVTGIATQGSCAYTEWAKSYSVSFSTDAKTWAYYQESGNKKIFQANTDKTSIVTHSFQSPIQARYMRVWPQTWNNYPAIRVEYYGCRQ